MDCHIRKELNQDMKCTIEFLAKALLRYQEHILGGPGGWGGGPENRSPDLNFGRESGKLKLQTNHCTIRDRDTFSGTKTYINQNLKIQHVLPPSKFQRFGQLRRADQSGVFRSNA
eukprot:311006-Pelagomonas_calceolata.AAC.1